MFGVLKDCFGLELELRITIICEAQEQKSLWQRQIGSDIFYLTQARNTMFCTFNFIILCMSPFIAIFFPSFLISLKTSTIFCEILPRLIEDFPSLHRRSSFLSSPGLSSGRSIECVLFKKHPRRAFCFSTKKFTPFSFFYSDYFLIFSGPFAAICYNNDSRPFQFFSFH